MLKLFKKKAVDHRKELEAVLGEYELPTFPAIVASALQRVRDEDAATSEIGDLIASDPGLSVRLLRTVNSAAFALRHRVSNIHHAVSLLGRSQLESMMISIAVRDTLPVPTVRGYDGNRFWTTSARRATVGRSLADLLDPSTRSECFTASLLQDLAIPVLALRKGDAYGGVLETWHAGEDDLVCLEREAFGWDHARVASWLCQAWEFPDHLVEAIASHHGPDGEEQETGGLPAVELVAELREVNEELGVERLVEAALEHFGIPEEQTRELVATGFEQAEEIAAMFTSG